MSLLQAISVDYLGNVAWWYFWSHLLRVPVSPAACQPEIAEHRDVLGDRAAAAARRWWSPLARPRAPVAPRTGRSWRRQALETPCNRARDQGPRTFFAQSEGHNRSQELCKKTPAKTRAKAKAKSKACAKHKAAPIATPKAAPEASVRQTCAKARAAPKCVGDWVKRMCWIYTYIYIYMYILS